MNPEPSPQISSRSSKGLTIGISTTVVAVLAGVGVYTINKKSDSQTATSATTPTASPLASISPTASATVASATATPMSTSIVSLAQAFANSLSDSQRSSLNQEFSLTNQKKWSNLPQALSRNRIGLSLGTLSDVQKEAFAALMKAASGTDVNEGYDELQQLLAADDYLAKNGGGSDYGRSNYYVALLGTPSDTGTWELQVGGHHYAFANTYTNGVLAGATPSFRGVEPYGTTYSEGGVAIQPLLQESAAWSALFTSLTSEQRAAAKLNGTFTDLVVGPGKDGKFPTTQSGIAGSSLTAEQKKLLLAVMQTYVGDVDATSAAKILAKYTSEIDATYISFAGTTSMTTLNDYARIDGPSAWIEWSMQRGIVLSGNHPHSVWRDKISDYGGSK